MNLDHLASFLEVARQRNYTRAAVDVHLSQSAVWRQIRQLESRLGVRLFEHIGRELHLTEAGRELQKEARALLGHVGRIEEAVRAHGEQVLGRIRIGASTTAGFYLLPQVLGRFHMEHPDVELDLEIDNSSTIEERLIRNEIDLAFVGGELLHRDLSSRRCAEDEIVCFAAPAHELAGRARVTPAALRDELCVVREEGSATRSLFESWMAAKAGTLGRTLVIRCPEALKALVAGGLGYSFLSIHGLRDGLDRGEIVRLKVPGLSLTRSINVAWHRGKHLSPAILGLIGCVDEAASRDWRR